MRKRALYNQYRDARFAWQGLSDKSQYRSSTGTNTANAVEMTSRSFSRE
jgi:hypothetical protein